MSIDAPYFVILANAGIHLPLWILTKFRMGPWREGDGKLEGSLQNLFRTAVRIREDDGVGASILMTTGAEVNSPVRHMRRELLQRGLPTGMPGTGLNQRQIRRRTARPKIDAPVEQLGDRAVAVRVVLELRHADGLVSGEGRNLRRAECQILGFAREHELRDDEYNASCVSFTSRDAIGQSHR